MVARTTSANGQTTGRTIEFAKVILRNVVSKQMPVVTAAGRALDGLLLKIDSEVSKLQLFSHLINAGRSCQVGPFFTSNTK